MSLPGGSGVKNPPANAGDGGSIPGSGRSPGVGNGNALSILAWRIPQENKTKKILRTPAGIYILIRILYNRKP